VQDARQRRQDETIGSIVRIQAGAEEEQLRQGSRMEGERDFGGDGSVGTGRHRTADRTAAGAGRQDLRGAWISRDAIGDFVPLAGSGGPGQAKRGYAGLDGGLCRRIDLGGGQDVGEWVEVVAGADSALGAGLQRCRAAAAERVEDDVAGPV